MFIGHFEAARQQPSALLCFQAGLFVCMLFVGMDKWCTMGLTGHFHWKPLSVAAENNTDKCDDTEPKQWKIKTVGLKMCKASLSL